MRIVEAKGRKNQGRGGRTKLIQDLGNRKRTEEKTRRGAG
jgi:hypothetical protein